MSNEERCRTSLSEEEISEFYKTLGLGTEEERGDYLCHNLYNSEMIQSNTVPPLTISDRTIPLYTR
jgi:hypothetical protein